ncbi:hypothetical protein V8G54_031727 [Vigna mungo]|uniref:Berberine/berberine-like domain-containing protein n=1 Tax=Vigna mungo TaxID=3915 RepID=A0AAQ3MLN4_VIGMU
MVSPQRCVPPLASVGISAKEGTRENGRDCSCKENVFKFKYSVHWVDPSVEAGVNTFGKNSYKEGEVYGIKYFKSNFQRLVKVKTKVDPHNFFRNQQKHPRNPYFIKSEYRV